MANIRELDKRRKSIRNIRKITRTMELIATARFKKAMDRATRQPTTTRSGSQPSFATWPPLAWRSRHPLLGPTQPVNRLDGPDQQSGVVRRLQRFGVLRRRPAPQ